LSPNPREAVERMDILAEPIIKRMQRQAKTSNRASKPMVSSRSAMDRHTQKLLDHD
jgi:hypothetical protein